jgi:signal transduction histidine kinase
MDQLQHFIRTCRAYSYIAHLLTSAVLVVTWWLTSNTFHLGDITVLFILLGECVLIPILTVGILGKMFFQPIRVVWQAILYMSPDTINIPAPDVASVSYSHDLAENLVRQIYRLADIGQHMASTTGDSNQSLDTNFVANSMPLPLVILDKEENIVFANTSMLSYLGRSKTDTEKQNAHSIFNLSFRTDDTLEKWLNTTKQNTVTATQTWEHVRLQQGDDQSTAKYFDLVAYYNQANTWGYETMLVLFDRTKEYSKQEQAMSFVALAVHELRSPLTMLRGYIEALDEELAGKINPELTGFLQKTQVAAGQLATFVNNILNVARIDDDQMLFKLHEEKWQEILPATLNELALRASVHGITIKTSIAPDLPTVGIDRVSMYEVISNLIDNAIKYSRGKSKEILVTAKMHDGVVETTVQDYGVGIPETAIPHLFTRFYRDYHNKAQVVGTGIGLYLCKTFVKAHGGNIWVRSKEGEGATFGFTLQPYANLANELKNTDNKEIIREPHGWIKNHSLYRG